MTPMNLERKMKEKMKKEEDDAKGWIKKILLSLLGVTLLLPAVKSLWDFLVDNPLSIPIVIVSAWAIIDEMYLSKGTNNKKNQKDMKKKIAISLVGYALLYALIPIKFLQLLFVKLEVVIISWYIGKYYWLGTSDEDEMKKGVKNE